MIFHAIPKIYNPYSDVRTKLTDISIPEIGLTLKEGVDVVCRKPYPNKCLDVACKKIGRKAMEGILISIPDGLSGWTLITSWSEGLKGENLLIHEVNYKLADNDHQMVTDSVVMWSKFSSDKLGYWDNRHPDIERNTIPLHLQPVMHVLFNYEETNRDADLIDSYSDSGQLIKRQENFVVPTLEPERLFGSSILNDRVPMINHIFNAANSH